MIHGFPQDWSEFRRIMPRFDSKGTFVHKAMITAITALKGRANTRTRAEIYNRLIDKFGTAPEFIQFLQSDAGLKFIEENTSQAAAVLAPLGKILASIQIGIVLALVGTGLLVTGNVLGESLGGDLYIVLNVGAIIGLTVGIGLLIAGGGGKRPNIKIAAFTRFSTRPTSAFAICRLTLNKLL